MSGKLLLSALAACSLVGAQTATTLKAAAAPRVFGAAISERHLSNATDTKFTELAQMHFSAATPENEMKWESTEMARGVFNFTLGDAVAAFAKKSGQQLNCHTLVWHSQLGPYVADLRGPEVVNAMLTHIDAVAGHWKNDCDTWDVVNEPFNDDATATYRNSTFYNVLGPDYIEIAFLKARQVAPKAKLYINDYNVEGINPKSTAHYNVVKALKAKGLIDGFGMQAHLVLGSIPTDIAANIKRFTDLGVDVAITELDIRGKTPFTEAQSMQQAREYAQVVSACVSNPRCVRVTTWGISDAYSWIPGVFEGEGEALLWSKDYAPKLALNSTIAALQAKP